MVKRILSLSLLILVSLATYAGGLLTNTNQHIAYLRNMARQSSTEIDAIYYNPAGLSFLEKDGLHFSINGQSAFQTRTIHTTFPGFQGFGGDATKKYKGEASAPFLPSLFGAYKSGKWTLSGMFGVTGGGGKATFDQGLGSLESMVSLLPMAIKQLDPNSPADKYSFDSYVKGKQIIYGLQFGASYKINEHWSAFGGLRINYVGNQYEGYIRDISMNFFGGDNMVNASTYLKGASVDLANKAAAAAAAGNQALADELAMKAYAANDAADNKVNNKYLDMKQTGWGITPILGVHYHNKKWDVGVKYEFVTRLNLETKSKGNISLYKGDKDVLNIPYDLPSILTVGVGYKVLPTVRLSVGYNHYFDKGAKMADNKNDYIKQGTNEYLAGVEWDVIRWIRLSAGMQRTKYGVSDRYQSDMSFALSSYSFGLGAAFRLAENVRLNVGYFWTNYSDYTKESPKFGMTDLPGTELFSRTNKVFGMGIDFSF